LLIGGTAGGAAGPCTEMLFWEMVPVTIMHTVSGCAFIESCFAAFNKYQDRPGVLEARFTAELAHAISKAQITREKANDLVNSILNEKLSIYDGKTAPEGKTFKECFDISKIKPIDEYYDRYKRIKMQAEDLLGISI
jgi:methylamine--corrinoid protein Co-methyltransferase